MQLPNISICMPIYNRRYCLTLIYSNIKRLDYPADKLELVIDDDSDKDPLFSNKTEEDWFRNMISPIKLKYLKTDKKRSIGSKRNNLVKNATYKIIACMDSDDLYLSDYLTHSIETMRKEKAGLVGSNQMLFVYPRDNWLTTGIQCAAIHQIHEASMVFTKKYWKAMGGFKNNSQGEGVSMVIGMKDNKVGLTEIWKIMICICHKENTINKDNFKNSPKVDIEISDMDKELIKKTFNIN